MVRLAFVIVLAAALSACGGGSDSGSGSANLLLSSPVGASGDTLPAEYTCDGAGSSIALSWSGAPARTREFALLMTTLPGDGTTKYNWVVYGIPAGVTSLPRDSYGLGTAGVGSDGPIMAYQPPCSQGPGAKQDRKSTRLNSSH